MRIAQEIQRLNGQLAACPEGKIFCVQNGKYVKWFQSVKGSIKYINKKNRKLAEQLAAKRYILEKLEHLQKEQTAMESYCEMVQRKDEVDKKNVLNSVCYQDLLQNYFKPDEYQMKEWEKQPYEKNRYLSEKCIHQSTSGNKVRSKSELLIDMALYENKIPFRYECALQLGASIIFPDFTIKHPKTGEILYWEHFGCMDNMDYVNKNLSKLKLYTEAGIVPDHQLIMTFETGKHPLEVMRVNEIIRERLLC